MVFFIRRTKVQISHLLLVEHTYGECKMQNKDLKTHNISLTSRALSMCKFLQLAIVSSKNKTHCNSKHVWPFFIISLSHRHKGDRLCKFQN